MYSPKAINDNLESRKKKNPNTLIRGIYSMVNIQSLWELSRWALRLPTEKNLSQRSRGRESFRTISPRAFTQKHRIQVWNCSRWPNILQSTKENITSRNVILKNIQKPYILLIKLKSLRCFNKTDIKYTLMFLFSKIWFKQQAACT